MSHCIKEGVRSSTKHTASCLVAVPFLYDTHTANDKAGQIHKRSVKNEDLFLRFNEFCMCGKPDESWFDQTESVCLVGPTLSKCDENRVRLINISQKGITTVGVM